MWSGQKLHWRMRNNLERLRKVGIREAKGGMKETQKYRNPDWTVRRMG